MSFCPYVQNMTTGQIESEPPGPNDAGVQKSLGCYANYINSLGLGDGGNMISFGGRPVAGFGVFGLEDGTPQWQVRQSGVVQPGEWFAFEFAAPASWSDADVVTFKGSMRALGFDDTQSPPMAAPSTNLQRGVAMEGKYIGSQPYDVSKAVPAGTQVVVVTIGTASDTTKKSNTGYYIAGGVAAAALVGGAIVLSRRKRAA